MSTSIAFKSLFHTSFRGLPSFWRAFFLLLPCASEIASNFPLTDSPSIGASEEDRFFHHPSPSPAPFFLKPPPAYPPDRPRRRIIGTTTPGRVSEPCNRRPFRAVRGALESAAGARQRLDPYPIFGPIPPSYYQKMRFLPNPSLLLQPLPN